MAMKLKKQVVMPAGPQTGIITSARETKKSFGRGAPQEDVVEIVIQPKYQVAGFETLPVAVTYAANLSTLGGLYAMLKRIGHEPKDDSFAIETIDGTEVHFVAERNDNDFMVILKDSIRAV